MRERKQHICVPKLLYYEKPPVADDWEEDARTVTSSETPTALLSPEGDVCLGVPVASRRSAQDRSDMRFLLEMNSHNKTVIYSGPNMRYEPDNMQRMGLRFSIVVAVALNVVLTAMMYLDADHEDISHVAPLHRTSL